MRTPEAQNVIDVTRGWIGQLEQSTKELRDVLAFIEAQFPLDCAAPNAH